MFSGGHGRDCDCLSLGSTPPNRAVTGSRKGTVQPVRIRFQWRLGAVVSVRVSVDTV